jgi:hypothetical protein
MEHLSSYPQVYQLGHKSIKDIFDGPVLVEEKIDGSQFSWGIVDGQYGCRSHKKTMFPDAPEKMFAHIIETTRILPLQPGWIYRGELLNKPKHNCLSYSRVPAMNVILFDIMIGPEDYLPYEAKVIEAKRLGLEVVPLLFYGMVTDYEMFKRFLATESILGNTTIEGVVVKNYNKFTEEKKVAMGKYVSEVFKEENKKNWRADNPTSKDIAALITERYHTEARWRKAIIHLEEEGKLNHDMTDIPALLKEVPEDVLKSEIDTIKDALFTHFWKGISRGITRGLPEFYKEELAKSAFTEKP